ncbi:monocarboxylate transporter 9-like [Haliotis cracherodii]|uniref:monocarboxylate transporter 9-like n=1 Tax=Haliotis cracherodii TaxID=6455 RepID=UPI0039E9055D
MAETKNLSVPRSRHQSAESSTSCNTEHSDSSSSSDSSVESLPHAPDGGWGWVVVLGAFIISVVCDGCAFSFGVLYTELLDHFGESKSKTSWVGSLFVGVPLICGPLASALVTKFGCRKMTIVAGFVTSAGFILSSFGNSIEMLCITFGLVAGVGMSFCYVTTVVIVAFYFEQKRALATGLAVCGSGIGTFIIAPLTEYLIDEYGWRGTVLILGGVLLNIIVCGALFRPLKFTRAERRRRALEQFDKLSRTISRQSLPSRGRSRYSSEVSHSDSSGEETKDNQIELEQICHSQVQLPTYVNSDQKTEIPQEVLAKFRKNGSNIEQTLQRFFHSLNFTVTDEQIKTAELLTVTSDDQIVFMTQEPQENKLTNGVSNTSNDIHPNRHKQHPHRGHGVWQRKTPVKPSKMVQYLPLYRKDIFYRGNLLKLSGTHYRSSSCPELYISSFDDDEDEDEDDIFEICPLCKILRLSKQVKRVMKTMFDVKILGNPLFLVFAISNFILYFWYDVPYVFMADRATELGISEEKASLIISVIGIVNTFGQVLYGYLGDKNLSLNLLYAVSCILSGVSVLLVPLMQSYWYMCTLAGSFGFFIGSNYALTTVMLVEFLGIDKLTNACGLLMMIQGIANLIGPPVAGWMYDETKSYDATFYAAGAFIIIAGAMLLVIKCLKRVRKWQRMRHYNRDIVVKASSSGRRVHIQEPSCVVVEIESVV